MRDRVTGEESAGASLGGQLVVVAGAKGGVGTTTVALHLGIAAARMAPGRPVCLVDFDLQKGDFRSLLDTPHRRSVVDLVVVSSEISVRHLQETLYTHKDGFRLLLAPEQGEKAEDVDATVARNVLSAVKARHALTVVDIGAVATDATAIAAELATQVLVVTTPDVVALRGVRRMRDLWKRLGVREDEDVKIVLNRTSRRREIQPDLARKVVGDTMVSTTIPADFNAFEAAVNTGSPSRLEDNKLRSAFEAWRPSWRSSRRPRTASRATTSRAACWRGSAASAASSTAELMGLFPVLIAVILCALADRADRLHVHRAPATPPARARASSRSCRSARRPTSAGRSARKRDWDGARLPQGRARGSRRRLAQARRHPAARRRHRVRAPARPADHPRPARRR